MTKSIRGPIYLAVTLGVLMSLVGRAGTQIVDPASEAFGPAYILGPDDQIVIHAFKAEEISDKPIAIGSDGMISLPMVGVVKAAGLSVRELENELAKRLAEYVQHPSVAITVSDYRSQPVSVLGDVNSPGVHELRGQTSLLRVLSLAGGMKADAGYRIMIVRKSEFGPIPLHGATLDSTAKASVAEVSVKDLIEARRPEDDIVIKPYDVITVPRAEVVYVIGEVNRAGAFVLNEKPTITILEALSRAEGLKFSAKSKSSRILRTNPGGQHKTEVTVDVSSILQGKSPDVTLYPDDVLFIPNSPTKVWTTRSIEAMIQVGTGVAIYRP